MLHTFYVCLQVFVERAHFFCVRINLDDLMCDIFLKQNKTIKAQNPPTKKKNSGLYNDLLS